MRYLGLLPNKIGNGKLDWLCTEFVFHDQVKTQIHDMTSYHILYSLESNRAHALGHVDASTRAFVHV